MLKQNRLRFTRLLLSITTFGIVVTLLVRNFFGENVTESVYIYFFVQDSKYSAPVAGVATAPALTRQELEIIRQAVQRDTLSLAAIGRPVNGNSDSCRKLAIVISNPEIESTVKIPSGDFVVVHDSVVSYPQHSTDGNLDSTLEIRTRDTGSGHQTTYLYYPNELPGVGGNAIDWEWVSEVPKEAIK
jgi:hypothetical protein